MLNWKISCFPLSFLIANEVSVGFGLLVGQKKEHFWHSIDWGLYLTLGIKAACVIARFRRTQLSFSRWVPMLCKNVYAHLCAPDKQKAGLKSKHSLFPAILKSALFRQQDAPTQGGSHRAHTLILLFERLLTIILNISMSFSESGVLNNQWSLSALHCAQMSMLM